MKYRFHFLFLLAIILTVSISCGERPGGKGVSMVPSESYQCMPETNHPLINRAAALKKSDDLAGLMSLLDSLTNAAAKHNLIGEVKYNIGKLYSSRGEYDLKYQYYSQALQHFEMGEPLLLQRFAQLSINAANAYLGISDKQDSLILVSRNAITRLLPYSNCPAAEDRLVELYHMVGVGLRNQGHYDAAEYYLTAGERACADTSRTYWRCGRLFTELAKVKSDLGKYDDARENVQRARDIFAEVDSPYDDAYVADNYDAWVDLAKKTEQRKELLEAAGVSIIYNRRTRPHSIFMGHSYNNLALAYSQRGDFVRAEELLDSAMWCYREENAQMDFGTCYENYAAFALALKDTSSALAYLDSAEIAYHGDPLRPALTSAIDRKELQDPLMERAALSLRLHDSRPEEFSLAEVRLRVARVDSLFTLLQYGVGSEASKRENIKRLRTFYERVVAFAYNHWRLTGKDEYLALGQFYLERNKGRILRERRRNTFAGLEEDGGIANDAIFAARSRLTGFQLKLRTALPHQRPQRRREVQRAELQLRELVDKGSELSTINFLQAGNKARITLLADKLDEDQIILDYLVGEEGVFVSYATANQRGMLRLRPSAEEITRQVRELTQGLEARGKERWNNKPDFAKRNQTSYHDNAVRLYAELLAPVVDAFPQVRRLTIIPDGVLGYVPFGALLTEAVADVSEEGVANWPFALRKYTINYEFSTGLWHDRSLHPYDGGQDVLLISPEQHGREEIHPIGFDKPQNLAPLSKKEGPEIAALTQPTELSGADVRVLKTNMDFTPFGIVHFTGHGVAAPARPEASVLVLDTQLPDGNKFLTLPELEALPLNIQMLVLSACQTGVGEVAPEEGVICLGRAGAIAGARSIVSSLWFVNQASKAELFGHFYKALSEQRGRDESLRSAQLALLNGGGEYAHPYHWAGFLNTGETAPLVGSFLTSGSVLPPATH